MALFMISRVDYKSTGIMGVGILNTKNKEVKIIKTDAIIQSIKNGSIKIENLKMENGELKSTSGHIELYPIINTNGDLIDNPTIVVLYRIIKNSSTIGYAVSDYKGKLNIIECEDLSIYENNIRIANGSITVAMDKYIIDGDYPGIDLSKINKSTHDYTGEKLHHMPNLKPILVNDEIRIWHRLGYKIIELKDKQDTLRYHHMPTMEIRKLDIKRDVDTGLYQSENYTFCGTLHRKVMDYIKHGYESEFNNILHTNDNMDIIKTVIEEIGDEDRGVTRELMKGVQLVIPDKVVKSSQLIIDETIKNNMNRMDIDRVDIVKLIKELRDKEIEVISRIDFGHGAMVLNRMCSNRGVDYNVLTFYEDNIYVNEYARDKSYTKIIKLPLEVIYEKREYFGNVITHNNKMYIYGLDGVYKYDMDKILCKYNRKIVNSHRGEKAKVLGFNYKDVLYSDGDLRYIETDNDTILIPEKTRYISSRAIKLIDNNTHITFGPNIEDCSHECIEDRVKSRSHTLKIDVKCGGNVGENIIRSMYNMKNPRARHQIVLNFHRDITPIEYAELIYGNNYENIPRLENVIISSDNLDTLGDALVSEAINYILKNKMDNFKIKNKEDEAELITAARNFRIFYKMWRNHLREKLSIDTAATIDVEVYKVKKRIENDVGFKLED